jgi:hypothetical protein
MAEFSERTRRLAEDHAAAFPGTAGFVAAVDDARNVIEAKPPVFSFKFYLDPNPQTMGGDPNIVFPRLVTETEGWLGSIVHSTEYRIANFLDDLVTGINDARPYRSVGAARSFVELSAFVHHYTKTLVKEATKLSSQPSNDSPAIIKYIVAILKAATHFAQVTRFNWGARARGEMEEFFTKWDSVEERVKAPQILTLIDKLPGEEKRAARFFYEMLCDYVHPNLGAHSLVINRAEALPSGQMRHELSREPDSDEALSVLIHAVAIPVRSAIRILLDDLEQLRRLQDFFGQWRQHCEAVAKGEIQP